MLTFGAITTRAVPEPETPEAIDLKAEDDDEFSDADDLPIAIDD